MWDAGCKPVERATDITVTLAVLLNEVGVNPGKLFSYLGERKKLAR